MAADCIERMLQLMSATSCMQSMSASAGTAVSILESPQVMNICIKTIHMELHGLHSASTNKARACRSSSVITKGSLGHCQDVAARQRLRVALCLQDAFGILMKMGEAGVMPTVDTYNTLMDVCTRRSDPQAVTRLFQQMRQAGS